MIYRVKIPATIIVEADVSIEDEATALRYARDGIRNFLTGTAQECKKIGLHMLDINMGNGLATLIVIEPRQDRQEEEEEVEEDDDDED